MTDKCKILLCESCRSDAPLTEPIKNKLMNEDWVDLITVQLKPGILAYNILQVDQEINIEKPDLIYISGDRIEMYGASVAAFHRNVPICVYGSGITNTIATFDDVNRHSMALMADICLVENFQAYYTTRRLHDAMGKAGAIIETVGNLYLEGLDDVDESLVPDEPYDLILINPTTLKKEWNNIGEHYRNQIVIGPNPDEKKEFFSLFGDYKWYDNLPRPQFLGLMKQCERFITNSSSAYYESSALGLKPEQIIMIGERNKGRSTPTEWDQDYKTSDKIIKIIKGWWLKQ